MNRPQTGAIIGISLAIGLFLISGLLMTKYGPEIETVVIDIGTWGYIIFILVAAFSVIIPLSSNLFLIPIASQVWGPNIAALLCIIGWWFGSFVSFAIARFFHDKLLEKYPNFSKYQYVDKLIPERNPFFTLILLRMSLPVDILSYALGLFSKHINWKQNALTTLIGIAPFAFVFAYVGKMSLEQQVLIFGGTATIFFIYYYLRHKKLSV